MAKKQVKSSKTEAQQPSKTSNTNLDGYAPPLVYKEGTARPFLVTEPTESFVKSRAIGFNDRLNLGILIVVSIGIRLQKLAQPNSVVFDEVHFGGFASKYILGTFFMDVHPPLAKMLFAGVGSLFGFKGDFNFEKIGLEYPATVPYVHLRGFASILGIATVVLFYLTLKSSGVRPLVALFGSLLFSFENSYVTISRYILLDSPLIFFIAAAGYSYKRFQSQVPFSIRWWRSLLATGVALGLAVSSKWVGLFTIAWIGVLNVWDLWFLIGDLSVPTPKILKQTFARGSLLLGVPAILYLFFFSVHFNLLNKEGDGGAFMTSAFRTTLQGNKIPTDILADVGVGSVVSIRHIATQGGYLHSHDHKYETGSKQQQITLYPHLDANNLWEIGLYNVTDAPVSFEQITDGTKIRLKHVLTHTRLHSHDEKCPVSESDWQKEVTAYGYEGFGGDANDDFVVEIQKKYTQDVNAQTNLRALQSVFRLRHAMTGCYVFSHEVKLPKWGFEQQEVTCATQGVLDKSLWYIEDNTNQFLPADAERINYEKPSLLQKVIESHKKMWEINQNLKTPHAYESLPTSWPFLTRGINYWGSDHSQIYLFGNIPVWWTTTFIIFAFVAYAGVQVLRWHLGASVGNHAVIYNFNVQTLQYILGWLLHYFPSYLMGRQLFLHHYLPAYYFGILALTHFLDILVSYVFAKKRIVGYTIVGIFVVTSFLFFIQYSPIIYALPWTKSQCVASKLLSGWDYDCNKYFDTLAEYSSVNQGKFFEPQQTALAANI